jgi:hypothetical protein
VHVPYALKLMRKCSPTVPFFVATDTKTPVIDTGELDVSDMFYIPVKNNWKCNEAIGTGTIARRNIAFLEALKWGADAVYSWDDDNLSVDLNHFAHFNLLQRPFDGIQVSGAEELRQGRLGGIVDIVRWFDPGSLLIPATRHRGFPHNILSTRIASPVTDARIGVAAGLVIGDPDIDAVTRMEHRPDIGAVHILGQTGVVVDPYTWTVFNSQNTAVIRELIPAWFMAPGCGRHDDIFASQVVQKVMRERGYHVHFGQPFTFQQRNEHDLLVDLRAEIGGMSNVVKMAALLDTTELPGKSVIDDVRIIYEALAHTEWYPKQAVTAALAYLDDCELVL